MYEYISEHSIFFPSKKKQNLKKKKKKKKVSLRWIVQYLHMVSQKEKYNNAHMYLYTCIEEWALFVIFQNHKTFYFAFGSKMVLCRTQ